MRLTPVLWLTSITPTIALSLPRDSEVPLQLSKETSAAMSSCSNRQAVPGDSPAFYVGDPSSDILSIDALDLLPNPPIHHMTLRLRGSLTSDVGSKARIKLTVAVNGTVGPSAESDLCSQDKLEITQNGTSVCSLKSGSVEMSYSVVIPYWWMVKGNYSVHTKMYTADGIRMTEFEGTVWINGEASSDRDLQA